MCQGHAFVRSVGGRFPYLLTDHEAFGKPCGGGGQVPQAILGDSEEQRILDEWDEDRSFGEWEDNLGRSLCTT